jgi:Holliday junction resolvasome RuvABC DNA-binding subunit
LREKGRGFHMNAIVEMANQSAERIRKISEGGYREIPMKNARRIFAMEIQILNTAIRAYRLADKNRRAAGALQSLTTMNEASLIALGLDRSEIQNVIEKIFEKFNPCSEMVKKICKNRNAVEMDEALREMKLQSKLINTVVRAKGALKKAS